MSPPLLILASLPLLLIESPSLEAFTPIHQLSSGRLLQEEVKGGRGFQRAEGRQQTWMEDGGLKGEGCNLRFVANKLALLLVLRRQVQKKNEENKTNQAVTRAQKSVHRTLKATDLKRAFIKLWGAYEKSLKNYVEAEKKISNILHSTPSLSYQINGKCAQDLVPWMSWTKCQSNCPACTHVLTMPLQSRAISNAEDARRRAVTEADGGDGGFEPAYTKIGCYCYEQNCFGNEDDIGCRWPRRRVMPQQRQSPEYVVSSVTYACAPVKSHLMRASDTLLPRACQRMQLRGVKNVSKKLKSNLHDNSIREYQGFDSRSNDNVSNDILITTAKNDIYLNESLQSDAHVMRGLQDIIPGRRTTVSVTPAGSGNKVNVSLQQLKKELKGGGGKKNPPEQQLHAVSDHTPSGSIFISNVSNLAWHNQLSSVSMDPHRETRTMAATAIATAATAATATASTMMGRVKKRVLNVCMNSSMTSWTKKVAAKVHARNDAAFTSVIDSFQDIQRSQEILSACFDLQRAMDD